MEEDLLCKDLQESLPRYSSVVHKRLRENLREEDSVFGLLGSKIISYPQVAGGGVKKDFCCQETDIFAISGKGALDVNQDYGWRLE